MNTNENCSRKVDPFEMLRTINNSKKYGKFLLLLPSEIHKLFSRNRIIQKRINVRIEHVRPSKCRQDFLNRVKENEEKKKLARETGQIVPIRRMVGSFYFFDFKFMIKLGP